MITSTFTKITNVTPDSFKTYVGALTLNKNYILTTIDETDSNFEISTVEDLKSGNFVYTIKSKISGRSASVFIDLKNDGKSWGFINTADLGIRQ